MRCRGWIVDTPEGNVDGCWYVTGLPPDTTRRLTFISHVDWGTITIAFRSHTGHGIQKPNDSRAHIDIYPPNDDFYVDDQLIVNERHHPRALH